MPLAVSGVRGRQPATPVWPSSYGDTTDSQPRPWTVPVASRQLPAGFDGLTCRRRRYTSINFSTLSSLMRGRKSTSSTIIQRCRSRLQSAYKVNDCSCIAPSIPRRNLRKGARNGGRDARAIVHLRSEEHTSELQSREKLVCRLLLEKKYML